MKKYIQLGDLNEDTVQNGHQIQITHKCES
jgi:hypothetical protein